LDEYNSLTENTGLFIESKMSKEHFTVDLSSGSNGKYLVTLYFKSGEKVSNTIILNR